MAQQPFETIYKNSLIEEQFFDAPINQAEIGSSSNGLHPVPRIMGVWSKLVEGCSSAATESNVNPLRQKMSHGEAQLH
jgi:hypothetical protein